MGSVHHYHCCYPGAGKLHHAAFHIHADRGDAGRKSDHHGGNDHPGIGQLDRRSRLHGLSSDRRPPHRLYHLGEADRLCHVTCVPKEWAHLELYQTVQPATTVDSPYGLCRGEQRARPKRLENHHLGMDMVCVSPFDMDRLRQETKTFWDDNPLGAAIYARCEDQNEAPALPFPPDTAPCPEPAARQGERAGVTTICGTVPDSERVHLARAEWRHGGMTVNLR